MMGTRMEPVRHSNQLNTNPAVNTLTMPATNKRGARSKGHCLQARPARIRAGSGPVPTIESRGTSVLPRAGQKRVLTNDGAGKFNLAGSADGRNGSVIIHADVDLLIGRPGVGGELSHSLAADRSGWLHVARGLVAVNGAELSDGDGVAFERGTEIKLRGLSADAEILLFDLAASAEA